MTYQFDEFGGIIGPGFYHPANPENPGYRKMMLKASRGEIQILQHVPKAPEPRKISIEEQLEDLKSALIDAKVLSVEQVSSKR